MGKLSFLVWLLAAPFVLNAAEGNALVTASVLKMRETPSLSGKVVMTLARCEMVVVKQFSDG
jgi:nitrate/nitrite transporter NarK